MRFKLGVAGHHDGHVVGWVGEIKQNGRYAGEMHPRVAPKSLREVCVLDLPLYGI
jgi:hypothetical protein